MREVGTAPAGASFDTSTGQFAWTPSESQQGTYEVVFTATDDGSPNLSASETITITVNEVNEPPQLPPIPDQLVERPDRCSYVGRRHRRGVAVLPQPLLDHRLVPSHGRSSAQALYFTTYFLSPISCSR